MEGIFFQYQLKSGILLSIFVILYALFLSKDHSFRRNRFWLLSSLLIPWIVPLLNMPVFIKELFFVGEAAHIPLQSFSIGNGMEINSNLASSNLNFSMDFLLFLLYCLTSLVVLLRLLSGFYSIFRIRNRAKCENYKGFTLAVYKDAAISPFSFFRTIYISREIDERSDKSLILEHERKHCAEWHSIDQVLVECVLIFQWWNPFAWWLRKLITQNHEYSVDNAMINEISEPKEYQYSILRLLNGQCRNVLVNNFNQSLTKKRIVMMNKSIHNTKSQILKALFLLPLLAIVLVAFTNPESAPNKNVVNINAKKITSVLDFQKHLAMNIKYPIEAQKNGIVGKVLIRFTLDENGNVSGFKFVQKRDKKAFKIDEVVITAYKPQNEKIGNKDNALTLESTFNNKHLKKEIKRLFEKMPNLKFLLQQGEEFEMNFEFLLA